ncbi:hypothetical protein LZ30DRAFT_697700 [Colletotrichum cereale]|nr:hypothetical protein LZ30DRAFT_697700 [Colletotrichum cereale]
MQAKGELFSISRNILIHYFDLELSNPSRRSFRLSFLAASRHHPIHKPRPDDTSSLPWLALPRPPSNSDHRPTSHPTRQTPTVCCSCKKQRADCLPRPQPPSAVQERAQRGCKHPTRLPKRIVDAIYVFAKGHRPPTIPVAKMADAADETKSVCVATVLAVFPEICTDFLQETAAKFRYNSEQTIDEILKLSEIGKFYPKMSVSNTLKRKRESSEDPDEEATIRRTYDHPNRGMESNPNYLAIAKKVLKHDFPTATVSGISKVLASKNNQLLPAYVSIDIAISELQRGLRENIPEGFSLTKRSRTTTENKYNHTQLDRTIETTDNADENRALHELQAARNLRSKRIKAEKDSDIEMLNFARASADGNVVECGCCFGELALNRAVCCQNLDNPHLFCVICARRTAEHAVGQSKYELVCMSMDQCKAGFSRAERQKFLTDQLSAVLDRIENEAVLRMSGIENLERCPFCPYAAEYPPIDMNREFRCENPDCQKVSCRLCKDDTHLPKTCEEAAHDKGIGAQHEIEEAMSAALIRKCNKCGTPFIKEMGCNKMTCTAANCRNIQCYVCSKSCDYSHFNDVNRGGRVGNCPLFDDVDVRHEAEVKAAEDKARQKMLKSNSRVDIDLLKFDMPEDNSRAPMNPNPNPNQIPPGYHPQGQPPPRVFQAPQMQVAQQPVAGMPVVGHNALGQQLPQGNIAQRQPRLFKDLHMRRAFPQQYPVPGQLANQVANQAELPAWQPAQALYRAYEGHGLHPGMAAGLPQQPQPPAPTWHQQPQVVPGASNIPHRPNLPVDNQPNPWQLQPMGPAAPAGPVKGAQPQPAPAPRELKRRKDRNKGARPPKNLPAMQQADIQPVRMPEPRQAEQQGWQMNGGQLSPRPEAQPPTAPAPNLNDQAAHQARSPVEDPDALRKAVRERLARVPPGARQAFLAGLEARLRVAQPQVASGALQASIARFQAQLQDLQIRGAQRQAQQQAQLQAMQTQEAQEAQQQAPRDEQAQPTHSQAPGDKQAQPAQEKAQQQAPGDKQARPAQQQAKQQAQGDRQAWQGHEALIARLRAQHALTVRRGAQQAQQAQQAPGDQQVRQEEKDAKGVQGGQAASQANDLSSNLPGQPPAPDHPNWLMPAAHWERNPQGLFGHLAAARQRAAATGAGGSNDEPMELD